jgi:hypothetical protein
MKLRISARHDGQLGVLRRTFAAHGLHIVIWRHGSTTQFGLFTRHMLHVGSFSVAG